jgi:hypothetical protein
VPRRRRRHRDPATAPRRPREQVEQRQRADAARRDVARVHGSLARLVALLLAAGAYFGVATANVAFGLFPRPQGIDLSDPQLLVAFVVVAASLLVARWLERGSDPRRLLRYAGYVVSALGAAVAALVSLLIAVPERRDPELIFLVGAIAASWVMGTIWLVLIAVRLRRLLAAPAS